MNTLKLALLASFITYPTLAQQVPAIDPNAKDPAAIRAVAQAQANVRNAQLAQAQAAAAVATTPSLQGTVVGTQNSGTVPATMPPPISPVSPNRTMTRKEAVGVATAQRWIDKFQKPILDHLGRLHFVDGLGQVQVVAAVDHVTDIELEPNENIFMPLSAGDSDGWIIHTALGREDGKPVAHIMIKPRDAGSSSNLVVHTSKRTLSIELTSRQREFMPLVKLDIPAEEDTVTVGMLATNAVGTPVQNACDLPPTVPKDQFAVRGDNVTWRPIEVYWVTTPVGTKTCVGFGADIGSSDLPALLALADDGGWFSDATKQVVNVRFVNRRYMVDEALSRFILVSGVGGDSQTITVTRRSH